MQATDLFMARALRNSFFSSTPAHLEQMGEDHDDADALQSDAHLHWMPAAVGGRVVNRANLVDQIANLQTGVIASLGKCKGSGLTGVLLSR